MDLSGKKQQIWDELGKIVDPEIPVLSLVEMKVIRDVRIDEEVTVVFSPTFVGCPATSMMMGEIRTRLMALGYHNVRIETTFSPPWSTDLLDAATREKLRQFGVAPPPSSADDLTEALREPVACPACGSAQTEMESSFGSTLCRQIYFCKDCRQSFERFKPL